MTMRKFLLWMIFIDFALLSAWALWEVGYFGIWQAGIESAGSIQILADLIVCCVLIGAWMVKDARERGVKVAPWLIATLFLGSIAPLVYLITREYSKQSKPTQVLAG